MPLIGTLDQTEVLSHLMASAMC